MDSTVEIRPQKLYYQGNRIQPDLKLQENLALACLVTMLPMHYRVELVARHFSGRGVRTPIER